MKTYISVFTIAIISLFSINSFALEDLQCSNADGTLRRVEEEIWGANPVKWVIEGKDAIIFDEKFDKKTKVLLDSKKKEVPFVTPDRRDGSRLVSRNEIYAIHVTVHSTYLDLPTEDSTLRDYVICRHHWDLGQD